MEGIGRCVRITLSMLRHVPCMMLGFIKLMLLQCVQSLQEIVDGRKGKTEGGKATAEGIVVLIFEEFHCHGYLI